MTARRFQALASAETDPLLRACFEIADLWDQYGRDGCVQLGSVGFNRWQELVRAAESRARGAARALWPDPLHPLEPTIAEYTLARDGNPAAMHTAIMRRLGRRRGRMPGQMGLGQAAEAGQ